MAPKTAKATTALATVLALAYATYPSLPDGIYLNLSAARYHADTALGSSNIRDLLKGANLYWFKSFLNPKKKKDKLTPSKILGNATHKLLLEGRGPFDAEYIRGPYGDDDEDLTPSEKTALTKEAKKKLLEGQELLKQDEYDFVLGCKQVLDSDPELEGCLDNALTEVSIFWTRPDGVRCKARLDALKIRGIGDIKTIANERERDLEVACKLDINTYRYDIPAEHYMEGRRQLPALLAAGKVFIEADDDSEESGRAITPLRKEDDGADQVLSFLARCVAQKEFAFQLVFIPKQGAPDAWSCVLSPGNPILQGAKVDIDVAISYYKMAMEKYGLNQRWIPGREVAELDIETMPYGFGRVTPRAR
jgi:hypothetical protein